MFLFSFFSVLTGGVASANPTGGRVVAGDGVIAGSGPRLDVTQRSERLGIEWRDFSIGRGEAVHFNQPSRSAVALNRVTGSQASHIEGLLQANGNVFVVNRNGVIFHRSAVVDVGGLLATTSDISNEDFLAGRYRFEPPGEAPGAVVNEGRISAAEGGLVALVAPSVRNAGVIEARLGRVALASGEGFTLDLFGDELVSFAVDEPVARRLAGVDHSGTIEAAGGRVWLTAAAAKGVVDSAINLSGVVRAQTVARRDGRIVLQGGGTGPVRVAGALDATGAGSAGGGRIEVLGETVELAATAKLDASGGAGGGTVLVGGDYQGRGDRPRAATTTVAAGSVIRADATERGDGGTVVVWSDARTVVDGTLSARGGPAGGDGGLVETSSAGELVFSRPVRVSAPAGRAGIWLLDPQDIDIDRGKADSIESTLNEGGNVSIKTADGGDGEGNISVNASITKTEGDDASLSLEAHNRIDVNQPIRSEEGKLDVSLKAGRTVNVKADVETNGGRFSSRITGVTEPEEPETDDGGEAEQTHSEADEPEGEAGSEPDGETAEDTQGDLDSGQTQSADTSEQPEASEDGDTGMPEDGDENTQMAGGGDASPSVQSAEAGDGDPGTSGDEPVVADNDKTPGDTDPEPETAAGGDSNPSGEVETVAEGIESAEHVAATGSESADSSAEMPFILVEKTVATRGGDLSVDAGDRGAAVVTGTLDSSNTDAGQSGGDIEVLGEHVVLAGEAEVDASGDAGGGDIHIGGDYQGKGERRNAKTTTVGEDVTIRSDATGEGDAGTVVVWADDTTRFSGHISARGGPGGGDGGTVEVSGKRNLGFWGTVDADAPQGSPGTLLLDPDTLTIIDAERGAGELDLDVLCESSGQICVIPAKGYLPPPGTPDDLLFLFITPEEFEALGIDPDPNTPLNTLSWGRLIQMAEVTGFHIDLEAEQDITFAALNGTMSTRGSPAGGGDGWTITLGLGNPERVRNTTTAFSVTSNRGDIVFEDPSDNFAVLGGSMSFAAPEGELRLGNLYGIGPAGEIPEDTSWANSPVLLLAGGDIQVGTINTRNQPQRLADPFTGAPVPQEVTVADPSSFDPATLFDSPELLSDLTRGGLIRITSRMGNIDIRGPVFTGNGDFIANAAGTFTAADIDTGANRLIVKASEDDPGALNTLNTSQADSSGNRGVAISADKITFDQINGGTVYLQSRVYESDAITGKVIIDTFRNSDFIGARPESEGLVGRPGTDTGFVLDVGDDPGGVCAGKCIDNLVFSLSELGEATLSLGLDAGDELTDADTRLGLSGTVNLNLGPELTFTGGDLASQTIHVPPALEFPPLVLVAPPGATPIEVPLDPPFRADSPANRAVLPGTELPASPASEAAAPAGSNDSPQITFVETGTTGATSSADSERIKKEGKEERVTEPPEGCTDGNRMEWLQRGPRSAARSLDWGRRAGIGTDPEDTEDVFKPGSCYFNSARLASEAGPGN